MLRADPRRDKALLLKFSVEINDVGEIRQIDTFLDKLTQLKQAYAVFRESVKTTMTEAAVVLFSPKPKASGSKKSKTKGKKKAPKESRKSNRNEDGSTYAGFLPWARENCGSLSSIKGKSDPDIKTNTRTADQLCMNNIRWMLCQIGCERTNRRESDEEFMEHHKGPVEVICSSSDFLRTKALLDLQIGDTDNGNKLFRDVVARRISHHMLRTQAKAGKDDALKRVWKQWMANKDTTSKIKHTIQMNEFTRDMVRAVKNEVRDQADEWTPRDESLLGKGALRNLVPYPLEFTHVDDGEIDPELLALDHPLWNILWEFRAGHFDPDMFGQIPKEGQFPFQVDKARENLIEELKATASRLKQALSSAAAAEKQRLADLRVGVKISVTFPNPPPKVVFLTGEFCNFTTTWNMEMTKSGISKDQPVSLVGEFSEGSWVFTCTAPLPLGEQPLAVIADGRGENVDQVCVFVREREAVCVCVVFHEKKNYR